MQLKERWLDQISAKLYRQWDQAIYCKTFLLPCVYLHWQVITLSHHQSIHEDKIKEVLVCDSDCIPTCKGGNYQNYMLNHSAIQPKVLQHSPPKTSRRPSSASFRVTSVLIASPVRYATILLKAITFSASVCNDKEKTLEHDSLCI